MMKALVQRVSRASVSVGDRVVSEIDGGLLIFLGVLKGDLDKDALALAKKCCELRIFEDEGGKMNLSVKDVGGKILSVSQFTLAANCGRGRRPSFESAEEPKEANRLFDVFCNACCEQGVTVLKGVFGAHMIVSLENDGPVTIMLE